MSRWLAVGLGACYATGAAILLFVEPGMGFRSFADFWNPDLVVPALESTAWLIGDLCHVTSGVLLLLLVATLGVSTNRLSRLARTLGVVAGATFILMAMIDRAASLLPALVAASDTVASLAIGYVATRLGVLFAALFFLGGFVLALAAANRRDLPRWFVVLSVVVGIAAIGFVVLPTPIPVALAVWAFALAWVWRRDASIPGVTNE